MYKLYLTPYFRLLYPTYYVSVLELYYSNIPTEDSALGPIEIDDYIEYEIKYIFSYKGKKTKSYLVK